MNVAMKAVKTKKEINRDVIRGAVNNNKPITIRTFYLTKSSQDSLQNIIALVLEKFNKSDSMNICYNSVRGLVVNATKANIKRILFKELGLDITDPNAYLIGMEKIEKHLAEKNFYKFKDQLMKQDLTVKTTFNFNPEMLSITVKNNFILLPHEYQLHQKADSEKTLSLAFNSNAKSREFLPDGQIANSSPKVVSLNKYKMDQQIFSQLSNEDTNETIVKLDIVLQDRNAFKFETFHKNLDSDFFREQQLLLANFSESVLKTIQDRLNKARIESNEYIDQIQKVGREVFELNKKQIQSFSELKDIEIEKEINLQIEKHKIKLEEFNFNLDKRIENQSLILKNQASQHLTHMSSSSAEIIKSTKEEFAIAKQEIKSDLETEIHLAELMKHELLMEISSEKETLENSLKIVTDEIRKVEQFQTNKEIMDSLTKQSEEAFWKMSSNIEVIKVKEENINTFMSNINLLEAAIRNTDKEIKVLDHEKTEYLNEKGKVVQGIDSKIKQMEKFGEEIKSKLGEISGFERKLNVISGSLTEQIRKTKSVDDQLVKFTKEVFTLEAKKNELGHFVSEVDQKIALINSKTSDIKNMESKFSHIESMMIDLSARHKQITTMEDRLEEVKSNIEALLRNADEKISEMNSVALANQTKTGRGRPKKSHPKFTGVLKDIKENVHALSKKRMSIPTIATTLDINEEMVSLILTMHE